MRPRAYIMRSQCAYEAIRSGATTTREVADAFVRAGIYDGSAAGAAARKHVNVLLLRGRIERVGKMLRTKRLEASARSGGGK